MGTTETMRPLINEVRFNRLLTRAALLPLLLMLILSAILIWQIVSLLGVFSWVEHTDRAISQANLSQKLMIDMETGKRGYLLAGDPRYLEPYHTGEVQIGPALARLSSLTQDNPAQMQRIKALQTLREQWMTDAQRAIASVPPGCRFEAAWCPG